MISLIMPVFNNIKSIELVFQSIVDNLTSEDQLIIIDDYSYDGTWETLLALKDSKYNFEFILDRNNKNLGISSALNLGIKYATRPYIARHDGDDLVLKDRFKYQLELLKMNSKIDLLSSSKIIIKDYKNLKIVNSVYQLVKGPPIKIDRNKFAVNNLITHPGVICKAEVLKSNLYDKYHNTMGEDYHLWLRLINKKINLYIDETPVIMYFENNYPLKIKKQLLGSIRVRLLSVNLRDPIFCFYLLIGILLDFMRFVYSFFRYA